MTDYEPTYWNHRGKYQRDYDRLTKKLVPPEGKADTIAGEMLRQLGNLYHEHFNNGGCNASIVHEAEMYLRRYEALIWNVSGRLFTLHPITPKEHDMLADAVIVTARYLARHPIPNRQ